MSDDPKPTIRIASCRSDGRCPECGTDWSWAKPIPQAIPVCGCRCCPIHHEAAHVRSLLTEALRLLAERTNADIQRGMSYVLSIRCMRHHNVPQMNATEARGGECAACAVESTNQVLATIRTHEMAAEERANRMEKERDAARADVTAHEATAGELIAALAERTRERDAAIRDVEMWKGKALRLSSEADVAEQRAELLGQAVGLATTAVSDMEINADDPIGMMRRVVERVDAAIRERDEARAELAAGMRLDALGDRGSRERAERAEALLRECDAYLRYYMTKLGFGEQGSALLAKIREVLG